MRNKPNFPHSPLLPYTPQLRWESGRNGTGQAVVFGLMMLFLKFKIKIKVVEGVVIRKGEMHFPNWLVNNKNVINEGVGGNPPFMVMQIWLQNNNELKTTPHLPSPPRKRADTQTHLHLCSTS